MFKPNRRKQSVEKKSESKIHIWLSFVSSFIIAIVGLFLTCNSQKTLDLQRKADSYNKKLELAYKLFPDLLDTNSSKRDVAVIGLCEALGVQEDTVQRKFLYKILRQMLSETNQSLGPHKQVKNCFLENFKDTVKNRNLVYIHYNDSNCLDTINFLRRELSQITPAAELKIDFVDTNRSQIRYFNSEDEPSAIKLKNDLSEFMKNVIIDIKRPVGYQVPIGQLEVWFNKDICNK